MLESAIGRIIQTLRKRANLTQRELAYRTGLDSMTISRIERGVRLPSLETIFLLARALNTHASSIISEIENSGMEVILQEKPQEVFRIKNSNLTKKRQN